MNSKASQVHQPGILLLSNKWLGALKNRRPARRSQVQAVVLTCVPAAPVKARLALLSYWRIVERSKEPPASCLFVQPLTDLDLRTVKAEVVSLPFTPEPTRLLTPPPSAQPSPVGRSIDNKHPGP